jgi:hypothetical protein
MSRLAICEAIHLARMAEPPDGSTRSPSSALSVSALQCPSLQLLSTAAYEGRGPGRQPTLRLDPALADGSQRHQPRYRLCLRLSRKSRVRPAGLRRFGDGPALCRV